MECLTTIRDLSGYLDGTLVAEKRRAIDRHLKICEACAARFAQQSQTRGLLRRLPRQTPPAELETRLRVVASREHSRQSSRLTFRRKLNDWTAGARLRLDNIMRPLMLPVVGGFASACILFALLVPDFAVEVHPVRNDVLLPTLYTGASVTYLEPSMSGDQIELEVHVDEAGRMTDYEVVSGEKLMADQRVRRRVESVLLISRFNAAMSFGRPTTSVIRVRWDEVEVKG